MKLGDDPLKILERQQEARALKSCVGCTYLYLGVDNLNRAIPCCERDLQPGQRCMHFQEKQS